MSQLFISKAFLDPEDLKIQLCLSVCLSVTLIVEIVSLISIKWIHFHSSSILESRFGFIEEDFMKVNPFW